MPDRVTFSPAGALRGARQIVPLALSAFAYGSVFGVLARQMDMSLAEAALMSGLVWAGSAQLIVLDLWVAPLPGITIVLTTFVVNLRHVLMGAALQPWLSQLSAPKKYLSALLMVDENWALSTKEIQDGRRDAAFLPGSGAVLYVAWLAATVTGYVLGAAIADPARWGLDFAFLAVFLALLTGMWRGTSDLLPWAVAAAVAVPAAQWLPGKWYILLGGVAGSLAGAFGRAD